MSKLIINRLLPLLSTLLLGLMAGFFATYSFNVNYATLSLNGEMYATVQSLFNVNVRHFGFFLCFFGAGVVTVITGLLLLVRRQEDGWKWLILGICYTLGIILFTKWVNLPLNYYTESWDAQNLPSDWQAIREAWNQANLFRTCWNGILFLMAAWFLSGDSITS